MEHKSLKICITGAAGRIAYSLFNPICSGEVFGKDVHINLNLLGLPRNQQRLEGMLLELEDGAYPLLESVQITEEFKVAFDKIDLVVFLGGVLRKPGQERIDVLGDNVDIFIKQGLALNQYAKRTCRFLVVTNPCNILCYVLRKYATDFPTKNFTSLSRLDQNRAVSMIAKKAKVNIAEIKNIVTWGNHSPTMFPDIYLANISGKKVTDVIEEGDWFKNNFYPTVCKRGRSYLLKNKSSCILSAAKAVCDHLKDWYQGTEQGVYSSMGVISDGSYNIPKGVISSRPVKCHGCFEIEYVQNLKLNSVQKCCIANSIKDLQNEMALTEELLKYDEEGAESSDDEKEECEEL